MKLFDRVRQSCAEVAVRAKHVRILEARIAPFLDSLPDLDFRLPEIDAASHDIRGGEATVAYFLTLDAINFGSGYFAHLRPYTYEGQEFEGYFAVAAALKSLALRKELTAEHLADLSTEDCLEIFAQKAEDPAIHELMEHFGNALRELGEFLLQGYDGSWTRLIEAADHSAERLAELLIEMTYFRDVISVGQETYFLKRAQLVSADLALAFGGQGYGHFEDLDRLTIFADNQVPHVLRTDGLLEYTPELASKIAEGTLITAGSEEEIEIRACGIHAAELLLRELRRRGLDIGAMRLDYFLWNRGEASFYKSLPTHTTRSIYY